MKKPDPYIQKILFPILCFKGIDLISAKRILRILFIDIKMCLTVIGNYAMNFRPNPKQEQTHTNFPGITKWKMETLVYSLPLKKS